MSELYKSLLIIYPEIILSFVAMILLMLGSFFQKKSLNLIITISFLTLLFLSFHELIPISDKKVAFNSFFIEDTLSSFGKFIIFLASALSITMSASWLRNYDKTAFEFPVLIIFSTLGMALMVSANDLLAKGIDGVMVGRSAYQQPMQILSEVDKNIFGEKVIRSPFHIAEAMRPYLKEHCRKGGKPHQVTRHMIGLFHGLPGAKIWRQYLSNTILHNNIDFYDEALLAVTESINKSAA